MSASVWEAAISASHLKLNNLTCIVDNNKLQSDGPTSSILSDDSLASRWEAFGWNVFCVDGHNISEILSALHAPSPTPKLILASTVKGKGVPFMENDNSWHHGRLTETLYNDAISSLYKVSS